MPIIEGTHKLGGGLGRTKVATGLYSFAVDGGAVGDITLRGDSLPTGAIIRDALIDVDTALAGATATVAIKVESAADVQTAAAVSGAPWSTTGAKRATFTATTAPIKTTASRSIVATVGTAALTAGVFSVYIFYVEEA